ncbi:MAG: hypothetical protein NZ693_08630, partial [Thermoflexales bacterium]|nr:hypothetical protein [Thermoflexales bacterium]
GAPLKQTLTLHRVAQAAGVRVFALVMPELPSLTARRAIFRALRPVAEEHLLIYLTEDARRALFVTPRLRDSDGNAPVELRALPFEQGLLARTTLEQLGKLQLPLHPAPTLQSVRQALAEAFSVEAVTERFFNDYQAVFERLQSLLRRQTHNARWAHDFALQLLNRLMFLYFIQRKRFVEGDAWLGNNPQFVRDFWRAYQAHRQPDANFYADWLSVLFFEAFSLRFQAGRSDRQHLPPELREALATMPYLNGGLFTPNTLDEFPPAKDGRKRVEIPDAFFELLFDYTLDDSEPGFLERYNFTVSESTPLDVEVAVDPEMIGKVYESLINLTERGVTTEDRRGTAGIFYTPRVEIDLMCRLALVDALANRLPAPRTLLYDWVFAADPEDKDAADQQVTDAALWVKLDEAVRSLTICDPACGSGSFLVGMLQVLDDLQARCAQALGREETPYDRRRRIIGEQLYGVDAMDWAVHVAELRLWLQLTVEVDLRRPEAQLKPLLPNLSFKVRRGDSLVQEIGGISLGRELRAGDLPKSLRGKLGQLKARKLRFYQGSQNDPTLTEALLRQEEVNLFREVIQQRLVALHEREKALARQIEGLPAEQLGLGVGNVEAQDVAAKPRAELQAERAEVEAERLRLGQMLDALNAAKGEVPFVWDVAFVEIFEGEA